MKLKIVQLVVTRDLSANKSKILDVLNSAEKDEWVIFPEAILSGYYPDEPNYTNQLDWEAISSGLKEIRDLTKRRQCHCLLGSATREDGHWKNSVLIYSYLEEDQRHDKIELSAMDRLHFIPGNTCASHVIDGVRFGVQACREVLFPLNWSKLKAEGSQVIFHINNALHPRDALWEHVLITRAIENGVYVVSVNNGDRPQTLSTYIISPGGEILEKAVPQTEQTITRTISLDDVIDDLTTREDF